MILSLVWLCLFLPTWCVDCYQGSVDGRHDLNELPREQLLSY